ncbi:hypothetical protein MOQ_010245 [Trypanosoma cruzi marinkellei]|uniref:Glycosyltransferase n=1 Tax=Trypanosoma cruzi marinkellei TaxID=85056 RepID=K2MK52_TRYCR|nr:hypothetical protein MOQ_010245 [Trypanosoma cruzi marinkellei]
MQMERGRRRNAFTRGNSSGGRPCASRQCVLLTRWPWFCARRPSLQLWLTLFMVLFFLLSFSLLTWQTRFPYSGSNSKINTSPFAARVFVNTTLDRAMVGVDVKPGLKLPTTPKERLATFIIPYGGTEEEEGGGDAADGASDIKVKMGDDKGTRLQNGGYILHRNVCLAGNGTRLQLHHPLGDKMVQEDEVLFMAHGGWDSGELIRELTSLFVWLQQWELPLGRHGESRLSLRTAGGEKVWVPRTNKVILAVGSSGGGCCRDVERTRFDRTRLLHWIRVVTGHFRLPPWWSDHSSTADDMAATGHVVVRLSTGKNPASTSVTSSSLRDLGCYAYVVRTEVGFSRWFPSTSLAHRFRQRWMQYFYHRHRRTKAFISNPVKSVASMWGKQPLSPVLRRMIIDAVRSYTTRARSGVNETGFLLEDTASFVPTDRLYGDSPEVALLPRTLKEVSSLRKASPLRITVLLPCATEQYDVREMVLYLHEKFGRVSLIQVLYMYGGRPEGADLSPVVVSLAHGDYLEVVRLLVLTDLLITSRGAALVSMVAMQPGSVVVELFPRFCRSYMYLELAVAMRVVYFSHEGNGLESAKTHRHPVTAGNGSVMSAAEGTVNTSVDAADMHPHLLFLSRPNSACHHRRYTSVSALRLYHLVKNGLSSVWLRNGRFSGVTAFDRR